jgi:uncharacterized membrane protein YjfL (UPF0719 family)
MWAAVGVIVQIVFLLLKNMFEKDAKVKKAKEDLAKGVSDAIQAKDISSLNRIIDGLRK